MANINIYKVPFRQTLQKTPQARCLTRANELGTIRKNCFQRSAGLLFWHSAAKVSAKSFLPQAMTCRAVCSQLCQVAKLPRCPRVCKAFAYSLRWNFTCTFEMTLKIAKTCTSTLEIPSTTFYIHGIRRMYIDDSWLVDTHPKTYYARRIDCS